MKVTSSYNAEARTYSLKFRYGCLGILLQEYRLSCFLSYYIIDNLFLMGHPLSQEVPPTPGQPVKEPMFIPVAVGLLDSTGKEMPLSSVYHDGTLQSVVSNDQPTYTTVLRVTKVSSEITM